MSRTDNAPLLGKISIINTIISTIGLFGYYFMDVFAQFEVTAIECISIGVKGVRQQSPDARMLGNCKRPVDSILQKTKADTLFLTIEIPCAIFW